MIYRPATSGNSVDSLLFIHGMCHGAWCWDQGFMSFFNDQGYDCYALDLTGHENPGKTNSINKVAIWNYIDDILSAVDQIGHEPIFIGHSMGGFVIQKYLEKHSCKKAVLMASVPPSGILNAALRYVISHPDSLLSLIFGDIYTPMAKYASELYHPGTDRYDVERYRSNMSAESFKVLFQMIFQPVKLKNPNHVPLLILGAKEDSVISEKEIFETGRFFDSETHILGGFGHNMMLDDHFQKPANLILNWLH